ncbi:MAG TPA: hypothetical protein VE990_06215 [Acidimicrobiales bacterium]|nr:hypothetical protein [Acidimicrobiales bacterium]
MPIHHTSNHPDSFGITYTGQACAEDRHEDCSAWWGKGHAGTRCACSCHLPEAPPPTTTAPYEGEDVLLFVSFWCKADHHQDCTRGRQPANRCACPCHHPDQQPD